MNEHFKKGFIKTAISNKEDPENMTAFEGLGAILGGSLAPILTLASAVKAKKLLPNTSLDLASRIRAGHGIAGHVRKTELLDSMKGVVAGVIAGSLAGDAINKNKKDKVVRFENDMTRASTLGGGVLGGLTGNYLGDRSKIDLKGKNIGNNPEARKVLSALNKSYRTIKKPSMVLSGILAGSALGMVPDIIKKKMKNKEKK